MHHPARARDQRGAGGRHSITTAHLNRVATSVPQHDVHDAFIAFARLLLDDPRKVKVFDRMAARGAIEHRFSTLSLAAELSSDSINAHALYSRGDFPGSRTRMRLFETAALPLALRAVAELGPLGAVTHLICVSCTGFYAPGLDLQIAAELGLATVERTFVGFMGCYAAFNALKLARHIVRSEPASRVLLVNLELCTLHLQESAELEQVLSFLVFGDGCSAALITADPEGLALDRFHAALVPASDGLITWRIGDQGFDMHLSGQVPGAIAEGLTRDRALILDHAEPADIDLWAVHPGGRSVLDAVQSSLALPDSALATSREILAGYGNMSSATIMFVLKRLMANNPPAGATGCALGFGPGLVAETMLFHAA